MVAFRKFNGLNIKCRRQDPTRHIVGQNDVLWRNLRKNPFRGVGCSELQEPPKKRKN